MTPLSPLDIIDDRTPDQIAADGDTHWPDGTPYTPPASLAPYTTATQYIDTAPTHELRRILYALTFSSPEVQRFINQQVTNALDGPPIDCTGDPLDDDDGSRCPECGSVEPCECDELWREEIAPGDDGIPADR